VLVDDDLRPLGEALAWFDPRRQGVFQTIADRLGPDDGFDVATDPVRTVTGWEWARSRADRPARAWIAIADLPLVRWSARPFLADTLAARTAAWRSSERSWSTSRVEATLGALELLPPVVATGDVIGYIASPGLRAAGVLAPDAIAVAGGHDHPVAGWAVDQMIPGAVLDSMGTAEVVVAAAATPVTAGDGIDIAPRIRTAGTIVLRVEELARNVQWASQDPEVGRQVRALLDGTARPADMLESGCFVPGHRGGGRPSYTRDAPRDPLARATAVLGALAVAGREAVAAVRAAAGGGDVRVAGGWVRSPGWLEIKATVDGRRAAPILEPEVTAVGAALLAATGRGWTPDPERALGGFTTAMLR
jgi:sugar (pentulose or hexulose) kinase